LAPGPDAAQGVHSSLRSERKELESMRAEVDEDVCIGSMSCENTCPEVFKVVGGISRVQVDVVPKEAEERCRQAADDCPVQAISVSED
jgi:ferredoxin